MVFMNQPGINVDIKGEEELLRKFDKLDELAGAKVVRRVLRSGAKVIQQEAIRLAPIGMDRAAADSSKAIRNNIKIRWFGRAFQQQVRFEAPHAHLAELGTLPRYVKSGGFRGRMPAKPYARPAFDTKKGEALKVIGRNLKRNIDRLTKKLNG